MKRLTQLAFAGLALLSFSQNLAAEDFIPKYGPAGRPHATLLKANRAFIKSAKAPDFWALTPYYEGMREGHSASAASVAMMLNSLRQNTRYSSSDELVTEESLLKKVTAENWAEQIRGEKPKGISLNQLGVIVTASLASFGLTQHVAEVIPASSSLDKAKIMKILTANERSDEDFIIAHYIQSAFTGDPEGAVGTFSPVAAFNANSKQVLILETDRKYYEPYWVSLDTFTSGLNDLKAKDDPKKNTGGLIWVHKRNK